MTATIPSVADAYARITGINPTASGKKIGAEYAVPCVNRSAHNHGDRDPSLHINPVKDAWVCRACGEGGRSLALVQFAGLAKNDSEALAYLEVEREHSNEQPAITRPQRRVISATYAYEDADGQLVYEVVRYEPKDFRQRRLVNGAMVWNLEGATRVPYHLPKIRAAIAVDQPIVVVEGEKDADALADVGFTATTNAGGAGWSWTAEFVQYFRGAKTVVVVADNDDPGRAAARDRATKLRAVVADVRLVEFLPEVERKGDVSDLIQRGWDKARFVELFRGATSVRGDTERISQVLIRQRNSPPPAKPIKTGFRVIDGTLGGLIPGQVSILAARPGVGKSAFAEQLAVNMSLQTTVLYDSVELDIDRAVDRIASRGHGMTVKNYREQNRPFDIAPYEYMDLHFCDHRGIDAIEASVLRLRPQIVIVDHLRELDGWLRLDGTRADLGPADIMRRLVAIGKRTGAHILALSQCPRKADGTRPSLADLRDSGAVEEKADNVFFLHRPFQFALDQADDVAEWLCWKSREYGTYISHMRWTGELSFFDDPGAHEREHFERCCPIGSKAKSHAA